VEDIPVLAYHFLRKAQAKVNKKVERISAEALDLLKRYSWPGNLRELENIIERAVVLARERSIEPEHLPLHLQEARPLPVGAEEGILAGKDRLVREFERQAVIRFLRDSGGNVSAAARLARITRRNFHRLLVKHRIDPKTFRNGTSRSHIET
jgi:DNA-binding NtrC family response regulator